MPSRVARNNTHSSNVLSTFISSGLVCHYDAWTKASPTQWYDLTANGYHITGSGISTVTFSNDPGVGIAYKSIGSGHYIILPNINSTGLFTTTEETIEMYIYPQSNNSVWFTETSAGVNSGWHIAKIILYNGNFYAYKYNGTSDPPACLLGKAYLNKWNHVVWRQVNNSVQVNTNWSYPTLFNFGRQVGTIDKPTTGYLNNYMGAHSCTMSLTTTYNYNGVTGNMRLVTATGEEYYLWVQNNGTNTSTTTTTFTIYLSNYSFPIAIVLEVYYSGWYFTNSSGYVNITYNTNKLDGYLNGSQSSFTQTNSRWTPWINNGGSTTYIPCMAYDSSTYGTAADPSGYVSLIRIYNRALSDSEILQNYSIFQNRYYLTEQNANTEPPMLLYYGNGGGTIGQNWWGNWVAHTYYYSWNPWGYNANEIEDVFANYNVNQNIGVDFDFFFYGTNYGKGQNGSIWINGYGALAFGTSATSNDWQPANGKALLIGWYNDRKVVDGYYSNHWSQPYGYSERAFTITVRNSGSYTYIPYESNLSYLYGTYVGHDAYYSFTDNTYWVYTVRLLKTNNYQYIDIRCNQSGDTQGRWQLCDGNSLSNITSLTGGQSMVLVSNAVGNNWTVYNPYYINDGLSPADRVYAYNVFMRYDANMLSKYYSPGDAIIKWKNSGNVSFIDMTATSVGSPTLSRTGRNFWVNFSANNQYFTIPQFNTNWIISSGGFTIAYSAYYSNPGSYSWSRIIDFGNGPESDNIGLGKYGTGTQMGFFIDNGSTRLLTSYSPTNPGDGNWHVVIISVTCVSNSITVTWYDNSTSGTSYTYTGNTITEKNLYSNYIGKSNWADSSFIGGMQEIIMFKGALDSSACSDIMTYLKNKWQL